MRSTNIQNIEQKIRVRRVKTRQALAGNKLVMLTAKLVEDV